jgi:hypothetical protein
MLRYLLDTNIVIYVIKNKPVSALELFNKHAGHMAISAITLDQKWIFWPQWGLSTPARRRCLLGC